MAENFEQPPVTDSSEHVNESFDIVKRSIMENDVTPKMARSLGTMYTLYSSMQLDVILRESPGFKVLEEFSQFLKDAVTKAKDQGEYADIGRFLKSESEKLGRNLNIKDNLNVQLGEKLGQMAAVLPE